MSLAILAPYLWISRQMSSYTDWGAWSWPSRGNWFVQFPRTTQFPLHRSKEEYDWNAGDSLSHFLVLSCLVIKVMKNYNNPSKRGVLMAQTHQESRFRSPHQAKKCDQLRCWNDSGNVVINISCELMTSCRNDDCNNVENVFLTLLYIYMFIDTLSIFFSFSSQSSLYHLT